MTAGVILLLLLLPAGTASADITGFYGKTVSPWSHSTKGVAIGITVIAVGVEFEYATSIEDAVNNKPGLTTGSVNVLAQTPMRFKGVRLYATAGVGFYHMLSGATDKYGSGLNFGGGVKISAAGPISIRLDYRVFALQNPPVDGKVQRVYAGLNLAF
jgi:opacity protein-like surface antigen